MICFHNQPALSFSSNERLGGKGEPIEVDETYVGAKRKRGTRPGRPGPDSHKTPVLGLVERRGLVRTVVMPLVRTETVTPHIRSLVLPKQMIYTDEYQIYNLLGRFGYKHKRIYHAARIYVDGDVHTNTIEGFFGLAKNGIRGVYHSVSRKHLQGYMNEYAFRYNRRKSEEPMFWAILGRVRKDPLLA